jgi:drug/metabolite transporter (DMT)-like permease
VKHPPIPPLLVLAFGILAVSAASIFVRYAQHEAPSLVIAAWRLGLATLVLLPLALVRRRGELAALSRGDLGLALLSGFFLALHFATWISSLAYTSVASSVVLVSTAPLWVALLSPFTIREPLTKPVLIGMLLALAGGALVGASDTCQLGSRGLACPPLSEFVRGKAFLGDLLALAGAVTVAGYLLIGRRLRRGISLLSYVTLVYGMAAIVLVGLVLITGQQVFGYSPVTYVWLLALALVPQLMGHTSYNWALAYLPAAFVSITVLGEPVGSSILAYLLLDERPTVLKIAGTLMILVSIALASLKQGGGQSPNEQAPGE